jgi:DNA-directed RNA polymerase subunit omega
MQSQLLEEASKVIPTPQVLVNVISRRVRQLVQGHRSLVEVQPRMGFADIALTEVIEGKLTYELLSADAAEPSSPRIVELPAITSRKKAA